MRRARQMGEACLASAAIGILVLVAGCGSERAQTSSTVKVPTAEANPSKMQVYDDLQRFQSSTIAHWLRVTDDVVVAEVTSESYSRPKDIEVERGEGLLGRTVTINTQTVIWTRDGSPKLLSEVSMDAAGAVFSGGVGQNIRKLVRHDGSRLEPGHRYILALYMRPSICSTSDGAVADPASVWGVIGVGGVIPYDGNKLGYGEFQGKATAEVPAVGEVEAAETQLRASFKGKGLTQLKNLLQSAKAGDRPGPEEFC